MLLQIAQTAVLARLLAPADFGLMAIAMAAFAIVRMFIDLGISNALIHFPKPAVTTLSTLFWLNLGAASILMLVFAALAWPLAAIYEQPQLAPVGLLLSLVLPISAAGLQFRVMAEKELHFSTLAVIEVIAALCGFLAALVVALLDGGVYALVAGTLTTTAISSGMAWYLLSSGLRPALTFRLAEARPYLHYGMYRLGDMLCNTLHGQADVLIGGAFVGASAMGIYTVPRDQSLLLANSIVNPVVTRIGLPVMARVQDDLPRLKEIFLKTLRMTSSINIPAYALIAVWADDVVAILLGSQWQAAGHFLRVFAVWGLIRSVGNPVGSLLYATGHVRRAFWWNLVLLLLLPPILYVGASLDGIHGLAWAMLCIQLAIFYPLFYVQVRPACGAAFGEYLGQLLPALVGSAVAILPSIALLMLLNAGPWLHVILGGIMSGAIYLAMSYWLNRQWFDAMLELAGLANKPQERL
jgi:O-antigen/teichoic acid export membrane protein